MKLVVAAILGACVAAAQPQQLGPRLTYFPAAPCRALDTRVSGNMLRANEERDLALPDSVCGLPAAALAYALNVTVVPREGPVDKVTFIQSFYSLIDHRPELNPAIRDPEGRIMASEIIVRAFPNGAVRVHTTQDTHLIIDVNGYWLLDGPGGLDFTGMQACRLVDTRDSDPLQAGEIRSLPIGSSTRCGVLPESAGAYALNITVIPRGPLGYLTVWPAGGPDAGAPPGTSVLNAPDGRMVQNSTIVANISGWIGIYATGDTDVIVDITGFFAPREAFLWR